MRNDGAAPHEFALFRGGGPAGGSATLSPGTETWVELVTEQGLYSAECWVPTPRGVPHADLGMRLDVRVGD